MRAGAPPEVSGAVFRGVRAGQGGGVRGEPRPAVPGPAQLGAVRGAALHGGDREPQSGATGKTHLSRVREVPATNHRNPSDELA